jgi:hypothetical protein
MTVAMQADGFRGLVSTLAESERRAVGAPFAEAFSPP